MTFPNSSQTININKDEDINIEKEYNLIIDLIKKNKNNLDIKLREDIINCCNKLILKTPEENKDLLYNLFILSGNCKFTLEERINEYKKAYNYIKNKKLKNKIILTYIKIITINFINSPLGLLFVLFIFFKYILFFNSR